MTPAEQEAVVQRVADHAAAMLAIGSQGVNIRVPELGEVWTISREPS